jgi:predicted RNA-binding Zn-ribbon protein involved in translation (DUF1610 family)
MISRDHRPTSRGIGNHQVLPELIASASVYAPTEAHRKSAPVLHRLGPVASGQPSSEGKPTVIGGETKVVFACPDCGASFICVQERLRGPQTGGFDCTECGAPIYRWSRSYVYRDWRPTRFSADAL